MSARLERAQLLIQTGRFADAEREAGMALAEDPDDAIAHALMAVCLSQTERLTDATEHAKQAVGLAPDVAQMHYILSGIWSARNFLDEAEEEARSAIELDPFDADYHHRLGAILADRKKWKEALHAADQGLSIDAEHVASLNLRAMALRRLGDKREAHTQLTDALANDPDDPWTHANVGWNLLEAGKPKEAMGHFKEALRLDPELDWARQGIVETLKAHNPIYRPILKFFLWVGNLSAGNQWKFILGAYIGFLISRYVARNVPQLRIVVIPLIVAYLAMVFVTWFARPLSNLALRFHPFGRLALSRDERIATNWVGGSLLFALISVACWIGSSWTGFLDIAMFYGFMAIPLAMATAMQGKPRQMMWIYTSIVAICGIGVTLFACLPEDRLNQLATDVGLDTMLALHRVALFGFFGGSVLSVWAANILASMEWKRY